MIPINLCQNTFKLQMPQQEKNRKRNRSKNAMDIQRINCPVCGNKVSSQAAACPHCGQPVGNNLQRCGVPRIPQEANASAADSNARLIGILGVVCAIVGFLILPIIFGPAGLILGIIAVRKQEEKLGWWGIVLGGINIIYIGIQISRLS